jgi:hypothetical protein
VRPSVPLRSVVKQCDKARTGYTTQFAPPKLEIRNRAQWSPGRFRRCISLCSLGQTYGTYGAESCLHWPLQTSRSYGAEEVYVLLPSASEVGEQLWQLFLGQNDAN